MSPETTATVGEQYEALRFGCGVVELSDWSSITVTGTDRQTFLHNFCTNDIKRLKPGESCEAFFTNVKGRIVGHGILSCRENEVVVIGVPSQAAALIAHLDRYVIREDVRLQDSTPDRKYLLIAGANRGDERYRSAADEVSVAFASVACELVGSEFERVFEVGSGDLSSTLVSLRNGGARWAGQAFNTARIEAGIPLFHVDFDETNLPQEVGRDLAAISFTKGCYLGQETVARIDALGHVNQRLVGARFFGKNEIAPGMELSLADKTVGRVTSVAFSPKLGAPLALAMVRCGANSPGTRLQSPAGEGEVIALPLAGVGGS
jgi:folate-binding protein YgfZ